eukprot:gene22528-29651_t
MSKQLTIQDVFVYPIKSTKGIRVERACLGSAGLLFDRQFMVAKADSGRFISQREVTKMALIETSLPQHLFICGDTTVDDFLTVTAPAKEPLMVPLTLPPASSEMRYVGNSGADMPASATRMTSKPEYSDHYVGNSGADMSASGTRITSTPQYLDYGRNEYVGNSGADMPTSTTRITSKPDFDPDGHETRFADAWPFLVANQASLNDLNCRLKEKSSSEIAMNRFRPNVVVVGAEPWEEDSWKVLKVKHGEGGGVELKSVKPCDRCRTTTIVQETGLESEDGEPLATLSEFRSGKVLGWAEKNKSWTYSVFFG